jgi:outer membrane protein TolC
MKLSPLVISLAGLSLAACVQFKPHPLSAETSSTNFAGRSLSDVGLKSFLAEQHAGSAWSVDKLALAAAYFHGDVKVAQAMADEAAAGITTAAQRPNPTLSFSPGYNSTSSGISPWIITPSLDVPIETAGKRGKRIALAQAEVESAKLMVAAAGWEARNKVRKAMLEVYAGRENAALLKSEIALHDEALKKLDAQVKAGEAPAFELTTARLSLNRSKLALHDAEKQSSTAMTQLASAVGVTTAALEAVTLDFSSFESFPDAPGNAARKKALTHRSDLLAALADYKATEAALRLEIAKQYPDVHLGPGYELDQGDNKWTLGLSIDLPILNQNKGPIAQAEAKRKTAAVKFEAKQAAVFGEIETALAAYRAAQAKATTAAQLADEAAHASDTTKRMVEAGELAPLELVRRRIEASASTLSRLESRIQAQEAIGQLEASLQLPLRSVK